MTRKWKRNRKNKNNTESKIKTDFYTKSKIPKKIIFPEKQESVKLENLQNKNENKWWKFPILRDFYKGMGMIYI